MKRALLLLAIAASLGANVLLALRRVSAPPAPASAAATPVPTAPVAAAQISPDTWRHLASDDLPTLIARLRAEGFPPAVVRAVVSWQVRQSFADRYRALADDVRAVAYWTLRIRNFDSAPEASRAVLEIERDISATVLGLLGPEELTEARQKMNLRDYGPLSAEKLAGLAAISHDYQAAGEILSREADGVWLPEDSATSKWLEKERGADVARLLTAEELFEVDLRQGRAADFLRERLEGFDATEEEFRRLFVLRRDFDEPQDGPSTPESRARRAADEQAMEQRIEAALGATRYAHYRRVGEPAWVVSQYFLREFSLPSATISEIAAMQESIEPRAAAVRGDVTLDAAQRAIRLQGLAQEAEARLTQLVEPPVAARYRDSAEWMKALKAGDETQP